MDSRPTVAGNHISLGIRRTTNRVVIRAAIPDVDSVVAVTNANRTRRVRTDQIARNRVGIRTRPTNRDSRPTVSGDDISGVRTCSANAIACRVVNRDPQLRITQVGYSVQSQADVTGFNEIVVSGDGNTASGEPIDDQSANCGPVSGNCQPVARNRRAI